MNEQLTIKDNELISNLVLNGDLSKLNPKDKVIYYNSLCERLGLDPLTQPFKLLRLNGKEILYADKGATQQLSKVYNISHEIIKKERIDDVFIVTVRAKDDKGRYTDEDGAVTIGTSKGDALANALMKAVTKAKRRSVLALCGLGMLDETEIETIPNAVPVEIVEPEEVTTEEPKENLTEKYETLFKGKNPEEIKDLYNRLPVDEKGKDSVAYKIAVFYKEEYAKNNTPKNGKDEILSLISKVTNKTGVNSLSKIDSLIEGIEDLTKRKKYLNVFNEHLKKVGLEYESTVLLF